MLRYVEKPSDVSASNDSPISNEQTASGNPYFASVDTDNSESCEFYYLPISPFCCYAIK